MRLSDSPAIPTPAQYLGAHTTGCSRSILDEMNYVSPCPKINMPSFTNTALPPPGAGTETGIFHTGNLGQGEIVTHDETVGPHRGVLTRARQPEKARAEMWTQVCPAPSRSAAPKARHVVWFPLGFTRLGLTQAAHTDWGESLEFAFPWGYQWSPWRETVEN